MILFLFFEQFAVPLQHNKDIKYEKEVNIYHFCIFFPSFHVRISKQKRRSKSSTQYL